MSPRAAWRLESIGFTHVYDYVAGKAEWGSFALPLEGRNDSSIRAASITRTDVPTCRLDEQVADVAARLPGCREVCVVTNKENFVLGVLGRRALRSGETTQVEQEMTPGRARSGRASGSRRSRNGCASRTSPSSSSPAPTASSSESYGARTSRESHVRKSA